MAATIPNAHTAALLADARTLFDQYLSVTPDSRFKRMHPISGGFKYPEATIQADVAVFSTVFTCLWRALEEAPVFAHYHGAAPGTFQFLVNIVTPPGGIHSSYSKFWSQTGGVLAPTSAWNLATTKQLAHTLRNGFNHFNFRYINVTPRTYFSKLALPLPGVISDPDKDDNYRIFICDWNKKQGTFMAPQSDTRIAETHFAHLRYQLFCFLASFFQHTAGASYTDLLTLTPFTS